jgi:hypothetical protein
MIVPDADGVTGEVLALRSSAVYGRVQAIMAGTPRTQADRPATPRTVTMPALS